MLDKPMTGTIDPYLMNRLATCKNPYQGEAKRVLCVCSAGLLRSPTTAHVLYNEFGYNTRAAGLTPQFALIRVDRVLLVWADEVVCMDEDQEKTLLVMMEEYNCRRPIICLDIPDVFNYNDPTLKTTIKYKYEEDLKRRHEPPTT